jgi:hypothetical protein
VLVLCGWGFELFGKTERVFLSVICSSLLQITDHRIQKGSLFNRSAHTLSVFHRGGSADRLCSTADTDPSWGCSRATPPSGGVAILPLSSLEERGTRAALTVQSWDSSRGLGSADICFCRSADLQITEAATADPWNRNRAAPSDPL